MLSSGSNLSASSVQISPVRPTVTIIFVVPQKNYNLFCFGSTTLTTCSLGPPPVSQCCWVIHLYIRPALRSRSHTTSRLEHRPFNELDWIYLTEVFVVVTVSRTCAYVVIVENVSYFLSRACFVIIPTLGECGTVFKMFPI